MGALLDALGKAAQVEIPRDEVARMFDLERIASASAPAFECYDPVGHGVHVGSLRRGIIHAVMGSVNLVDRMVTGVGEFRADARILERGFKELLAQAASVIFPIGDAPVPVSYTHLVRDRIVAELNGDVAEEERITQLDSLVVPQPATEIAAVQP